MTAPNPYNKQSEILDAKLSQAIEQIYKTYGDVVSITDKAKTLRKFGRNTAVAGSYETVWLTGGDETYATDNVITTVTSTESGDDQEIVIEGQTLSNGELTFYSSSAADQTITLNGISDVTLPTPLARVTRLYNNDTTDFAGTVTVERDDGTVHLTVSTEAGNQSEKASTSVSKDDYFIILGFEPYVFTKTDETVEFIGEIRQVGTTNKVWRRVYTTTSNSTAGSVEAQFNPPFIILKNHDIRVRAKSDGTSVDVGAAFSGYLAKIVS